MAADLGYELMQSDDDPLVFCLCGNRYERGGACNTREPADPALRGDADPEGDAA